MVKGQIKSQIISLLRNNKIVVFVRLIREPPHGLMELLCQPFFYVRIIGFM